MKRIQYFKWTNCVGGIIYRIILRLVHQFISNIKHLVIVGARINDRTIIPVKYNATALAFSVIAITTTSFPCTGCVVWEIIGDGLRIGCLPVVLEMKPAAG